MAEGDPPSPRRPLRTIGDAKIRILLDPGKRLTVGIEFSVPYNGDPNLVSIIGSLNQHPDAHIREVFLSGPVEYCSSGRVAYNGDLDDFSVLVQRMHDQGLRVNLVMNSTCEGVAWYSDGHLSYLHDFVLYMTDDLGIEAITLANPLIMRQINNWVPQVELCASVLSDIDCVERAKAFEQAGARVITPDVSINRDFSMLQRIKNETSLELKIMVNEGCIHKCPWRKFHFNAISHIQRNAARVGKDLSVQSFKDQCAMVAGNMFFSSCSALLDEDPSQVLKSGWIRPEDLGEYQEITSFFKISGRTVATHAVERMIRAYLDQSYEGDLLDIMDSSLRVHSMANGVSVDSRALGEASFFSRTKDCSRNCATCGFCDALAKHVVKGGALTDIKRSDRDYLS